MAVIFPVDTLKYIFIDKNGLVLIEISMNYVYKSPINNNRRQAIILINDGLIHLRIYVSITMTS